MPGVTRLGDSSTGEECFPPKVSIAGSPDVFVNGIPAHRSGDAWAPHTCTHPQVPHGTHGSALAAGSSTVKCNGADLGRIGDPITCGDAVASGSGDVFAGG